MRSISFSKANLCCEEDGNVWLCGEDAQYVEWDGMEKAASEAVANFGEAKDIFVPDYGWILKDGKTTHEGLEWYNEKVLKKDAT